MLIIEITARPNGAHRNQSGSFATIPDGWVQVPEIMAMEAKSYLPYIDLTVEDGQITAVAQGTVPDALSSNTELDSTTQLELAVAELAQTVEDNNTANQLAIAELAETLLGGAT